VLFYLFGVVTYFVLFCLPPFLLCCFVGLCVCVCVCLFVCFKTQSLSVTDLNTVLEGENGNNSIVSGNEVMSH